MKYVDELAKALSCHPAVHRVDLLTRLIRTPAALDQTLPAAAAVSPPLPPPQVKYVVELAKALSRHPAVHRVDLLTRLIRDPKVAPSYGELEEPLTEREGEMGGAYICRIKCGPVDQYLRWGWGLLFPLCYQRGDWLHCSLSW